MSRHFLTLLSSATLLSALCLENRAATAQAAIAPAPPGAQVPVGERKINYTLKLKNVPASVMAFWLDPTNHPMPIALQAQSPTTNPYLFPNPPQLKSAPSNRPVEHVEASKNRAGGVFELPQGIDRIVAIDPQNTLLVFGTDAGVKELQATIEFLDRPLRQVEIEAQWVVVSLEDAKAFGIQNDGTTDLKSPQLGFVRGNFQATLSKLLMEGKAKIITAPRILAINNLEAEFSNTSSSPSTIRVEDGPANVAAIFDGVTYVKTEQKMLVTPTINNDNTVTAKISLKSQLKLQTAGGELTPTNSGLANEALINVRDGETVALFGISSSLIPDQPIGPKNSVPNLIVFVTARIVRRAGDEVKPLR